MRRFTMQKRAKKEEILVTFKLLFVFTRKIDRYIVNLEHRLTALSGLVSVRSSNSSDIGFGSVS